MRINNVFVPFSIRVVDVPPHEDPVPAKTSMRKVRGQDDGAVLSPELTHYLSVMAQEPEVRAAEVERVTQLLVSGYYSSPASAQRTVNALWGERF